MLLLLLPAFSLSAESILLDGATVHTVSGQTFSPGQVLIQDGKIKAVGRNIAQSADQVIDLDGRHLYPGMIASTTALGLTEVNAVRATRDMAEVGQYTPDVPAWIAVSPDSELIPVARANGVSHALPVPQGGIVSGQSGLIALDGWTTEEMAVQSPVALHLFWPGMGLDTRPREEARDRSRWKSPEAQAGDRRKRLKSIEDFFEQARAYSTARSAAQQAASPAPEPNPSWDAMLPYVRGELPIMVHANDLRQIRSAVQWAQTNQFKIIIAGGRDAWRVAGLLASKQVPVIFENVFTLPARDVDSFDAHFKAPEVLRQAGARFAISGGIAGFDAGLVKNLPYHAAQAAAYGLPRQDALRAITLAPAEILGVDGRLGSIEAGKEATLFASDGDILDIRSNVVRMWIAGREISLQSRHTRFYDKYRARPLPE